MIVRVVVLVFAVLCAGAAAPSQATVALPHVEGPDVPPTTAPAAVIAAFDGERFFCTDSARTKAVQIPDGSWDRIIVSLTITPDGDPWDRMASVAVGGVEVIRATTPRAPMTLRRDVTEYAALLPPGATADVTLRVGSYVGALIGSVAIELYANEPTAALVRRPARAARPVLTWRGLGGDGARAAATVGFGDTAPASAVAEITMTGHGTEEFFFLEGPLLPRSFHIRVDGVEIGEARPLPYTYAFAGFGNADAYTTCAGPGTSPDGDLLHPVMWWTAQRAADAAGVHTGVGEIPPYRLQVDPAMLPLLTRERTVEVVQKWGYGTWITSLAILEA